MTEPIDYTLYLGQDTKIDTDRRGTLIIRLDSLNRLHATFSNGSFVLHLAGSLKKIMMSRTIRTIHFFTTTNDIFVLHIDNVYLLRNVSANSIPTTSLPDVIFYRDANDKNIGWKFCIKSIPRVLRTSSTGSREVKKYARIVSIINDPFSAMQTFRKRLHETCWPSDLVIYKKL